MKYAGMAFREIIQNRSRIVRLAVFENSAQNRDTFLGVLWNILNPALQIFVYWFVFSVGMKMKTLDGDIPYVVWLTSGILPWMAISQTMNSGTASFYANAQTLKSIRMPLTMIPVKAVVISGINHLWTMAALVPFIFLCGVRPRLHTLFLPYYMLCGAVFLIGFALAASAINAVFRDFQKMLGPVIRLLMYVSSVVWPIDRLSDKMRFILKLNPLTYIIEGYRDCLLYHDGLFLHWRRTGLFWACTLLLWIIGARLHYRLRKQFIDLI